VPVALEIYALDGRRLARIAGGLQDSGPRHLTWDGRDETGRLLPPGLYLFSILLETQFTQAKPLQALGIAY
jgi:flagellar hook assembly protein FlgD